MLQFLKGELLTSSHLWLAHVQKSQTVIGSEQTCNCILLDNTVRCSVIGQLADKVVNHNYLLTESKVCTRNLSD